MNEKNEYSEKSIVELAMEYIRNHADIAELSENRDALFGNLSIVYKRLKRKFLNAMTYAYDIKYGNWDEVNDMRRLFPATWAKPLKKIMPKKIENKQILLIGANDGREISTLFTQQQLLKNDFYVVDISKIAIEKCRIRFENSPNFYFWHGDIQQIKLKIKPDLIVALRTIHSTGINTEKCIKKLYRLGNSKALTILSVSNGYIDETGKALNGIYDFKTNSIDKEAPFAICENIVRKVRRLSSFSSNVKTKEGETEIFIYYTK